MSLVAIPKRIFQIEAPLTLTAVYTAITSKHLLKEITLCNTGNAATEVSLAVLPNGETLGTSHYVFKDLTLGRGETKIIQISLVLEPSDQLHAIGGSTGISCYCSGVEFLEVS